MELAAIRQRGLNSRLQPANEDSDLQLKLGAAASFYAQFQPMAFVVLVFTH